MVRKASIRGMVQMYFQEIGNIMLHGQDSPHQVKKILGKELDAPLRLTENLEEKTYLRGCRKRPRATLQELQQSLYSV